MDEKFQLEFKPYHLEVVRLRDKKHMKYPHPRFFKLGGGPTEQQQGFQLLATCKTVYEERCRMFYSQNTFYVPPGPIVIASHYFEHLQLKHRNLIRYLVLSFTVADLTAEGYQHVTEDIFSRHILSMNRGRQIATFLDSSMKALGLIWQRKLRWLLQWRTLEQAEMWGGKYKILVKGSHMAAIGASSEYPECIPIFWQSCELWARRELREQYEKCEMKPCRGSFVRRLLDVEPVKDWLHAQGPGIRCRPWDWSILMSDEIVYMEPESA